MTDDDDRARSCRGARSSPRVRGRQRRSELCRDSARRPSATVDRVYVRLEEARLRCEQLIAGTHSDRQRMSLGAIHDQLALAGFRASCALAPPDHRALLARAQRRAAQATPYSSLTFAVAALLIDAEDTLTGVMPDAEDMEHLHHAHMHLLLAMDLLHRHLYPSDRSERAIGGS